MANYGFDGVFSEAEFSQMWALGGVDAVQNATAWKVVSGSGRQVTVDRTGWAFAAGVLSKGDTTATVSLATPTAGQWHLIVRRINWAANTVTVVAVPHTTTATTTPTAAPTTYPTINSTPGTMYDQVLGWAWVTTANTLTTVFDLRGLPITNQATGLLELSRIPNLDASKVVSGTLDANRVPSLDAAKIGSGTFAVGRIPALPASAITSGVFDVARIPADDTGWSMNPIVVSAGWDTLVDPEGQAPSSIGGIRKRNSIVEIRFRISRNGATIASSGGNVADTNIASLPAAYWPASTVYGTASLGPASGIGEVRVDPAGNIILTALTDGSVGNDAVIQVNAMYFVG